MDSVEIKDSEGIGAALAAEHLSLNATLIEKDTRIRFEVKLQRPDGAFGGGAFRIWFGPVTLMAFDVPANRATGEMSFGPTFIDVRQCATMKSFNFVVTLDGRPIEEGAVLRDVTGVVAAAVSIADETAFYRDIQLHHSRYASRVLIALGARAAYHRFQSFTVRAAALTILSHRVLEKNFAALDDGDLAMIDWLVTETMPLAREGLTRIADMPKPRWEDVRWTVSLATVGANLSLCRNNLSRAREFFGLAASQIDKVWLSRVSALNLVNACFFHGLLSLIAGDQAQAKASLSQGVSSYPTLVAAQDMMENVWVIGDLINIAKTSRQCFIALALSGLITPKDQPLVDNTSIVDLTQVQSPVGAIAEAGRAPALAEGMAALKRSSFANKGV